MREIVTLFSCLPFTNVSASILPITGENFFLFFIAFIITFFLLGIIIGYILNPRRRLRKTEEKPLIEATKAVPEAPRNPGQDIRLNESDQQRRMDNGSQRNGNNYSNYWDYSNQPRRY